MTDYLTDEESDPGGGIAADDLGSETDDPEFGIPLDITVRPSSAMAVFFAWEKLRVLYNLVLFAVVICNFNPFDSLILAVRFLELTVAANLCFCVGPVLENYFCWFAYPHKPRSPLRWCMFVIGLVFSIPVSIVVCEQIAVHPEGRWQLGL